MKKIFQTLVVIVAVGCANPSFGECGQTKAEIVTGGACSISELRNIEKSKIATDKTGLNPKGERDLRPLRQKDEMNKLFDDDCLFGTCLLKTLLGN